MASDIVLFSGVFIMILAAIGGVIYMNQNYLEISSDLMHSQSEVINNYQKSNIKILNYSVDSINTTFIILNNGSVKLGPLFFDLYINKNLVSRNNLTKDVLLSENDDFLIQNFNLSIVYHDVVSPGDDIKIVCETGKFDNLTI